MAHHLAVSNALFALHHLSICLPLQFSSRFLRHLFASLPIQAPGASISSAYTKLLLTSFRPAATSLPDPKSFPLQLALTSDPYPPSGLRTSLAFSCRCGMGSCRGLFIRRG